MARKKMSNLDRLRRIVERKQYDRVGRCTVDLFSASAILAVYDAKGLSEENRERYAKLIEDDVAKAATLAFKLAS